MLDKIKSRFGWLSGTPFRLVLIVTSVFFILYKSVYQSSDHLNDIFSLVSLVVLLGLSYRYDDRWSEWTGAALIFLLFFPPLYWLWRSGQYDQSIIAGLFPIGDPQHYYSDALRLQYGYPLSDLSTRRPLFMGFLSVILKLTGDNLQITLIVLTFIVALAVFFLANELKKSFGALTAMTVVVLLYYCYKGFGFIGITFTEQLGLPLGALALGLFLQGIRLQKKGYIWLGLLTVTLALSARAGTFFIIPAIILWGAFQNQDKRFSITQFGIMSSAVLLGFLLNFFVFKDIGAPHGVLFANIGSTFYGVATGYRGWNSFYVEHPGVQETAAWPYIFEALRQNPWNLPLGIFRAYLDYLKPQTMFEFLYFSPVSQTITSFFLYAGVLFGLFRLIRMRVSGIKYFLVFALAGIFLSIPFTPPSDQGIRAMTSTMPFFMILPGLAIASTPTHIQESAGKGLQTSFASIYALILITVSILGPAAIKVSPQPLTEVPQIVCPPGISRLALWVRPGSYLRLIEDNAQSYSLVPDLRVGDLRQSIQKNVLDYFGDGSAILRRAQPNQTILAGLDLYTLKTNKNADNIWVIVPTKQVTVGQINRFCATRLVRTRFGGTEIFLEQSIRLGNR